MSRQNTGFHQRQYRRAPFLVYRHSGTNSTGLASNSLQISSSRIFHANPIETQRFRGFPVPSSQERLLAYNTRFSIRETRTEVTAFRQEPSNPSPASMNSLTSLRTSCFPFFPPHSLRRSKWPDSQAPYPTQLFLHECPIKHISRPEVVTSHTSNTTRAKYV